MVKHFTIHERIDSIDNEDINYVRNLKKLDEVDKAYLIEQKMKKAPHLVICTTDYDGKTITDFLKLLIKPCCNTLNDDLFNSIVNSYITGIRKSENKATMSIQPDELRKELEVFRGKEIFWMEW